MPLPGSSQEGYDVSLLALRPRDGRPSPSSSPPADPRASFHSHTSAAPYDIPAAYPSGVPSSHPSRDRDDEAAPLHPHPPSSRTSSDSRRFHRPTAGPPLSAPNPRRAAQAYSKRARAAERQRRRQGAGAGGALEKGGSARALWQRKGLLVGLALVVLLVCAGIGIGLGVSLSWMGGGGEGKEEAVEAASAETAAVGGPSGTGGALETQTTMGPTMAPTAAPSVVEAAGDDEAAPVPAPTHSAADAAPVPTDAAALSVPSWEGEESWSGGTEG